MEFSEKLQQLRKQKGLTQEELAQSLYVSRTAISKWESGQSVPESDKLIVISDFFGVSLDYLLKENVDCPEAETPRQENGKKLYAAWRQQADDAKKVYPSFDLKAEMNNPKFVDLLRSNIDVRTAYEVLHKDEIIPAAMQFTAKTVEQKLTNKIIANGARPSENGMSAQGAAVVKSDVSQLSKADRAEIIRRVQRGEKIRF